MVSLQVCLTGLTLFRRAPRLFFGAALRAGLFDEPRKSAQFLHHNSCSRCSCSERYCEGAPSSVPTSLSEGESDTPTITHSPAARRSVSGAASAHHLVFTVAVDATVAEESQSQRESARVFSLHCHGTGCHGCQFGTALLQHGAP